MIVATVTVGRHDTRVGDLVVSLASLGQALIDATGGDTDLRVMVTTNSDEDVTYERLKDILNTMADAGFQKVAIVATDVIGYPDND